MSETLRWRHPMPGRFETVFGGHELAAVLRPDGGWQAVVDGEPARLAHPDMRAVWPGRNQAQLAAVKSLMPRHAIVAGPRGCCTFAVGLPEGWVCGHDNWWIGHAGESA